MAATSHGSVHGGMHIHEVVCVLCAVKLEDKGSRVNVRGRTSFPIENELRKLPMNVAVDENSRICFPCLGKLKKRKSLEEQFAATTEELVQNHGNVIRRKEFEPSFASTPTKSKQLSNNPATSTPRAGLSPPSTLQHKNAELGVTVGFFLYLQYILLLYDCKKHTSFISHRRGIEKASDEC